MSEFGSVFAPALEAMLNYRAALGFSRTTYEAKLRGFDRYCSECGLSEASLTEGLVWRWLEKQAAQKRPGMSDTAAAVRLFGKYLSAVGQNAYILPDGMFARTKAAAPYIFTDTELASLFFAADHLPDSAGISRVIAPVLFRLIYTCGLRPNEGRELQRRNINFDTGEILITKTKRHKERIVVMSDDMLNFSRRYDQHINHTADGFFFSANDEAPLTSRRMGDLFNDCWQRANPQVKSLPRVRVYDLRHRFASAVLNRWLDEGEDLNAMLPYLSAYMGHGSLSETAYYIHILPENLVKSAGIDWIAFDGLIPEVLE